MSLRIQQHALSKGEISPRLYGRNDIATWNSSVKRARNVVVLKEGGMSIRMGMQLVGPVYDQTRAPRLVPFQFGLDQSYALEMGQGYMRPAALGGFILQQELAIVGISRSNPAIVTIQNHPYVAGDDVFFSGVTGMAEINGAVFRVVADLTANTFSIAADSTGWGVFTGAAGGDTLTAPIVAPVEPVPAPPVEPPPPPEVFEPGTGGGGGGWFPGGEFVDEV